MKAEVATVVVKPEAAAVIWVIIAVVIRVVIWVLIRGRAIFRPEVVFFGADQGIAVWMLVNSLYNFTINCSKDRHITVFTVMLRIQKFVNACYKSTFIVAIVAGPSVTI